MRLGIGVADNGCISEGRTYAHRSPYMIHDGGLFLKIKIMDVCDGNEAVERMEWSSQGMSSIRTMIGACQIGMALTFSPASLPTSHPGIWFRMRCS